MKYIIILTLLLPYFAFSKVDHMDMDKMSNNEKINFLWTQAVEEEGLDPVIFYSTLKELDYSSLSLSDGLKLKVLESNFGKKSFLNETIDQLSLEDALSIVSEERLSSFGFTFSREAHGVLEKAKEEIRKVSLFDKLSNDEILDIFENENGKNEYQNGSYTEGVRLFLFCKRDRSYPCLFVLKDRHNQVVRNSDGKIWSLKGLAYSRKKLPFNITNGQTPMGIHSMDSVMPEANNQKAYGKWRRVILNWIPKSTGEALTKTLLPSSSHNKNWWKQASIARDVGRDFLRIHGTGNRNDDKNSNHYTMFGTSGCISTQENIYDDIEYRGQRMILDKLMEAMNLYPTFSNEVKIKGLLYVLEIADTKGAVTLDDLSLIGIK